MKQLFKPRQVPDIINLDLKVTTVYFKGNTFYYSYRELIAILDSGRSLHLNMYNYSATTNKHRYELLQYLTKNPMINIIEYSFDEFQSFLMRNFDS